VLFKHEANMSDEPESGIFTTPADEETFEPLPLVIHDGSVAIFDQVEFGRIHNCIAARFIDGYLSVLDVQSGLWRDVGSPVLRKVQ
jgi:hypothetical protein